MKKVTVTTKDIVKVFWQHAQKYWIQMVIIVIMTIIASGVSIFTPLFYKSFFDLLAGGVMDGTISVLVDLIVQILLFLIVGWIGWRVGILVAHAFQTRVMADLHATAHALIHRHSYTFFSNNFGGSLVRKVNRFPRAFEVIVDQLQFSLLPLVVSVAGILIVLFQRSWLLGGILLVWTLAFLGLQYGVTRWKQKFELQRVKKDSETTGILADGITNNNTVKSFSGREYERSIFHKTLEELRIIRKKTWDINEYIRSVQAAFMIFAEFIMFYVAIQFWEQGRFSVGDFALIQAYLITLFNQVWGFGNVLRRMYEAFADAGEMVEIINMPYDVKDIRGAVELDVTEAAIDFNMINFSFNKTRKILNKLNLHIVAGERVAFVGPSGAGKSTVTKILMRFYDIDKGHILIDGIDIAKVTQDSLRNAIAYVSQDPILFHRTLMENIRYGRRDATDEEVIEAAKQAHCHEFISELQDGYDTYVGERGVKLSGGERQRVAIARALLKDAPILILDEATSSLDSESEALIQDALDTLMKGKTTIVIAHRLSTIMKMDRIVVIDGGKAVDSGTHDELKSKEGIYKKLWEIQAGGFIE